MRAIAAALLLTLAAATAFAIGKGTGLLQPASGVNAANTDGLLDKAQASARALEGAATDAFQAAKDQSTESVVEAGAPILESWILRWREQALRDGAEPMPLAIRLQLLGYFPETLLETVRYRVGWVDAGPGQPNLFRLLDARAVTLRDVIVFRDADIAADPVIWAHELTHVRQYDRWGTLEFARRYLRDHRAIEAEAWGAAARYRMWVLETERATAADPPSEK